MSSVVKCTCINILSNILFSSPAHVEKPGLLFVVIGYIIGKSRSYNKLVY